ncbi:MAG TPA: chemotaxis protein [Candidatus Aquabacterium excrementipullorum]|nr:chemotaxis protein [Candidatus Aquabacterium excrementipullorum]
MKFRTRIWMLPVSAAAVFIVGMIVSFVINERTSARFDRLSQVDAPYAEQVARVERAIEQVSTHLQGAAIEGSVDRLADAEAAVAVGRKALEALKKLDGKSKEATELSDAFEGFQSKGIAATRGMIEKTGGDDAVGQMQAALQTLNNVLKAQQAQSKADLDSAAESVQQGMRTGLWASVITALVVLAVLGAASWAIVTSVWKDLGDEPAELRKLVGRIAEGDLDIDIRRAHGDSGSLHGSLADMVTRLRDTVSVIRLATDSISTASTEIASGNQDLSSRTENTASNLQQAASSMEQLTGTVRQSADAARQANQLASGAATAAQRGGEIVSQVVANMAEIDGASRKINEIITVIDGIAFQTNILALNAAVEAARAGEQGRGFAVVAGEVRSLAQRSANAAKEIKTLISASSEKVESGSKLVQDAGVSMNEIMSSVQRVSDIIGEISAASSEQSQGIGQVNNSVNELDQMTQQNAALVEESAAAAESLRDQAGKLANAVAAFKLGHARMVAQAEARGHASEAIARAQASARVPVEPKAAPSLSAARVSTPAPKAIAPAAKPASPQLPPAAAPRKAPPASAPPKDDDWETF